MKLRLPGTFICIWCVGLVPVNELVPTILSCIVRGDVTVRGLMDWYLLPATDNRTNPMCTHHTDNHQYCTHTHSVPLTIKMS